MSAVIENTIGAPLYQQVSNYNLIISSSGGGDPADVYFPVIPAAETSTTKLPIALLLQGALVDKSDYSNYASIVARYGFVVVVPNNERTVTNPSTGQPVTGLLAEQKQLSEVLAQMVLENSNPRSPVAGLVDTETLGLLGHSFGGFVGLASIQDICFPGLCEGSFTKPPELKAGIVFGTSFQTSENSGVFPIVDNGDIPTGLIAGSLDSVAELFEVESTYPQIQNTPKALVTIEGANHYAITNEDNPQREPVRPTIDQGVATETVARWSGLFLRAHLLNDFDAFEYFYEEGDGLDRNVTVTSEIPASELVFGTTASDRLNAQINSNFDGFRDLVITGEGRDLVDSSQGGGRNRVYTGTGSDELVASRKDRLFGGEDNDILEASAGSGNNRLYGGNGNDEIILGRHDRAFAGLGNDTLDASSGGGGNRIYGNEGNDLFFLGSGDRLLGGAGEDSFFVNSGGNNTIIGGTEADQFWIANAQLPDSPNTIADFEVGIDVLRIGGIGLQFSDLQLLSEGANTIIVNGITSLAILQGIAPASLSPTDFIFT
ncbi:MAG: hypothetical protein QNJ54_20015 [Prochloraceae cyanobacterium]|nr:hypothetical protein [Prochloraceae cyanobacterium]